jgi:hypothetical protein
VTLLRASEEDRVIWRETPSGEEREKQTERVEGQPRGRTARGTRIYTLARETQKSQAGDHYLSWAD